jgi:hypothetical protein
MLRASERRAAGINPKTIAKAVEAGKIERIGRGIYQKPDAEIKEGQILLKPRFRCILLFESGYHNYPVWLSYATLRRFVYLLGVDLGVVTTSIFRN